MAVYVPDSKIFSKRGTRVAADFDELLVELIERLQVFNMPKNDVVVYMHDTFYNWLSFKLPPAHLGAARGFARIYGYEIIHGNIPNIRIINKRNYTTMYKLNIYTKTKSKA